MPKPGDHAMVGPDHPATARPAAMPRTDLTFTSTQRADGARRKETGPWME
ncbi:MAG TPA: hypothetical protein VND19_09485 [Acetobacteraceae bacterium]|nr:hypothetical protein [Acetobacteraceae bacterium]